MLIALPLHHYCKPVCQLKQWCISVHFITNIVAEQSSKHHQSQDLCRSKAKGPDVCFSVVKQASEQQPETHRHQLRVSYLTTSPSSHFKSKAKADPATADSSTEGLGIINTSGNSNPEPERQDEGHQTVASTIRREKKDVPAAALISCLFCCDLSPRCVWEEMLLIWSTVTIENNIQ